MTRGNEAGRTMVQPRRVHGWKMLLVAAVVLAAFGQAWRARRPGRAVSDVLHLDGLTMGTTYRVRVVLPPGADARMAGTLAAAVESRLDEINARMSLWDPRSELSRFNAHRSTEPFPCSGELAALVARALDVAARSGGAFDPTVGPLVHLWGFGPGGRERPPPSPTEVDAARERVGYLLVEAGTDRLRKRLPGVELDLGAIAKGHGADAVAEVVAGFGFDDYLVEIGGDLRVAGRNARGEPWRIAVDRPDPEAQPGERLHGLLGVSDAGVATSGDYRNFRRDDRGEAFAHILDPREGAPVRGPLASVTVVAGDAALADALATALFVIGPERGPAWLAGAYPDAEALFLVVEGGDVREIATPGFHARTDYRTLNAGPGRDH